MKLDGITPITEDGVYSGKYLKVKNEYGISDPSGILNSLIAKVGTVTAPDYLDAAIADVLNIQTIFRFDDNGAVAETHDRNLLGSNDFRLYAID